jgi:A/G-specific adenine glycosylase
MLQQTGVSRVMSHYAPFLAEFPTLHALARAPLSRVLAAWKGLGYNRRAIALRECARVILSRHGGRLPRSREQLLSLPGVGPATAGALLVFAFDEPVPFIETNVRRVFLHFFFPRSRNVPDAAILPVVQRTLDRSRPREWFYALMDYGTMLGGRGENANRRSRSYARQPAFEGSRRQLRGQVLAVILRLHAATRKDIEKEIAGRDGGLTGVLDSLVAEGFLQKRRQRFSLK